MFPLSMKTRFVNQHTTKLSRNPKDIQQYNIKTNHWRTVAITTGPSLDTPPPYTDNGQVPDGGPLIKAVFQSLFLG